MVFGGVLVLDGRLEPLCDKIQLMTGQSRIVYAAKSKQKRPFNKRRFFFIFFFILAVVAVGGFTWALHLPGLRIGKIEIKGAALLSAAEVESEIRNEISGSRFLILPRDNFFLVSSKSIAENLSGRFHRIAEVVINKKFPKEIDVEIRERSLWGAYCETPDAGGARHICFYIDDSGTAYEDISDFAGSLLPIVYSPREVKVGDEALSSATLEFYSRAKDSTSAVNANMLSITLSTSTPADARLNFAEGWYAVVTMARPTGEWRDILKTVLEKEVGDRRNQLEYVDLRFGNKVFYKYR